MTLSLPPTTAPRTRAVLRGCGVAVVAGQGSAGVVGRPDRVVQVNEREAHYGSA
jgi:hypothetical protein